MNKDKNSLENESQPSCLGPFIGSAYSDAELKNVIKNFVEGLLKKANCNHAGNCYAMCQILKPYLSYFWEVETLINNTKVKQGRKNVNHYYLLRIKDGMIIDATASQFKKPNGKQMPKIFIGRIPEWYLADGCYRKNNIWY